MNHFGRQLEGLKGVDSRCLFVIVIANYFDYTFNCRNNGWHFHCMVKLDKKKKGKGRVHKAKNPFYS